VRALRVMTAVAVLAMLIPIAGAVFTSEGHDGDGSLLELVEGRDPPFDAGDRGRAFDAPFGPPLRALAGAETALFLYGPLLLALAGMARVVRPRATRVFVAAALVTHGALLLVGGDALGAALAGKLLGACFAGVVVYWAAWSAAALGTVEGQRPPPVVRRAVVAAGLLGALPLPGALFLALVRYDLDGPIRAAVLLGDVPAPWAYVAVAALLAPAVAAALDVAGLVRRRFAVVLAAAPAAAAALAAVTADTPPGKWLAVAGAALVGAVSCAGYLGALALGAIARRTADEDA
jgi:hypothetical protein